jgi:hypothetical protein
VRCDGACDVMTLPVLLFCSPIVKLLEPAHRTTYCCCKYAPLILSRFSTGMAKEMSSCEPQHENR